MRDSQVAKLWNTRHEKEIPNWLQQQFDQARRNEEKYGKQ
jgi:hypothetical protein